jgi:hypothetical protein
VQLDAGGRVDDDGLAAEQQHGALVDRAVDDEHGGSSCS